MMANFKKAPLEIANSIPKSLYFQRVEQKWAITPAQSEKHFRTLLQTQSQLALSAVEANIRDKLISI